MTSMDQMIDMLRIAQAENELPFRIRDPHGRRFACRWVAKRNAFMESLSREQQDTLHELVDEWNTLTAMANLESQLAFSTAAEHNNVELQARDDHESQ